MDPKDVAQHMWEETRTKWCQEYEADSGTRSGMEDQLQRIIEDVTDSSMTSTTTIHESKHEAFGAVRNKLESIFDIVTKEPSTRTLLQDSPSINTEPWARNVQVPPSVIDASGEEFHQQLHPIQSVTLDLNKLSATVLVELQHGVALELAPPCDLKLHSQSAVLWTLKC